MTAPGSAVPVTVAFGRRVLALRTRRRWSREGMASRAGITVAVLRRIERCENTTLTTAEKVAGAFGKSLAELVAPASCGQCMDSPLAGYTCQACSAKGPEVPG
jgi:transcriptional regulator with XRE-family HTH domain